MTKTQTTPNEQTLRAAYARALKAETKAVDALGPKSTKAALAKAQRLSEATNVALRALQAATVERATSESVKAAIMATDEQHVAAIASTACAICGSAAGVECVYGAGRMYPGTRRAMPVEAFPGRAHTRRLRAYLEAGGAS